MKRSKKRITVTAIVLAFALLLAFGLYRMNRARQTGEQNYMIVQADRGDILLSIPGSGSVKPYRTSQVFASSSGILSELNVHVGDQVKKGDALGVVTQDIDALEDEIAGLNDALRQAELNLEKAKNGYSATSISAPISGVIRNINARAGEDASVTIQTYGSLAEIKPDGGTLSFIYTGEEDLKEGDALYVSKAGGPMLKGELNKKETGKLTIDVYEGQLEDSEYVSVYTRGGAYLGSAAFQKYQTVMISGTGRIASIPVRENEHVTRGQTVFTLQANDVSTGVSLAELSLSQARRNLDDALERQSSPVARILAPADGVITAITASEGSRVDKSVASFTLNETDKIQATVMVDEMDIVHVFVGQRAAITVDALPDKEYAAVVERFSHSGFVSGGVTQYQVTLAIENPEGILLDMSVSAEILVDERADILRIPSEALITLEGKYYVLSADIARKRSAKAEEYLIPVEIGLATESYIEILSGISEGDSLAVEVSDNYAARMMRLMGGGRL